MKKTIRDYNLDNKKVIIRCDLNVPIIDNKIYDDNRIKMSLQTIKYAVDHSAKVIILSHLGRIKSEEDKKNNSLLIVSKRLGELINKKVKFINETSGEKVILAVQNMKAKDIIMLENTRFEDYPLKKESNNDDELSKFWAGLADIFIDDAFAVAHRSHASNVGIAKYLPSGIGFLMEKEIKSLKYISSNPEKPFIAILGGSKMKDKIKVIKKIADKADYLLLAGGIANTFLKALGEDVGKSVYDLDSIDTCKKLLSNYKEKIVLPVDFYTNYEYENTLNPIYISNTCIPNNLMALDIGDKTLKLFEKYIKCCKSIFINGPLGVSEFSGFSNGTKQIFKYIKENNKKTIIGGGDSAASAINFGYKDAFYHISTGGGASLEYIYNNNLPGIKVIDEK